MSHKEDLSENNDPVEVPMDKLSANIVQNLIEEFVLREGTDYGSTEVSLEKKKEQVSRQLENDEIKIVFDPDSETVTLMTVNQFDKAVRKLASVSK